MRCGSNRVRLAGLAAKLMRSRLAARVVRIDAMDLVIRKPGRLGREHGDAGGGPSDERRDGAKRVLTLPSVSGEPTRLRLEIARQE